MSFTIEAQAHEVEEMFQDLQMLLEHISYADAVTHEETLKSASEISHILKTNLTCFSLDLSVVDDPATKKKYSAWLEEKYNLYKQLMDKTETFKHQLDRSQFEAESDHKDDASQSNNMANNKLVVKGDAIQNKTQEAVDRIRLLVDDADEVGKGVVTAMDNQLEQMHGVKETFNSIQTKTNTAKSTAMSIARNAASDRCVQGSSLCLQLYVCFTPVVMLIKRLFIIVLDWYQTPSYSKGFPIRFVVEALPFT